MVCDPQRHSFPQLPGVLAAHGRVLSWELPSENGVALPKVAFPTQKQLASNVSVMWVQRSELLLSTQNDANGPSQLYYITVNIPHPS